MDALLLLCAWCGVLIRPGKLPASHGICPACAETLRKSFQEKN